MRPFVLTAGLVLSLAAAVAPTPVRAEDPPTPAAETTGPDVVELHDGRRVTGEIVGRNERFVSIRSGGVLRAYALDKVASISRGERPGAATKAPLPAPVTGSLPGSDAGTADRKAGRKASKKADKARKKGRRPAVLSADERSWLLGLLERAAAVQTRDPAVRASLAAAIQAMGPAAIAEIRAGAAAAAPEARAFLERIAAKIEKQAAKSAQKRGRPDAAATDGARTRKRSGTTSDAPMRETDRATDARRPSPREALAALGLSRDQGQALRAALREFGAARREIYTSARNGEIDRAAAGEQIREARAATLTSIEGLLDANQFADFEKIADELLNGRAGRRGDAKRKPGKKTDAKRAPKDSDRATD